MEDEQVLQKGIFKTRRTEIRLNALEDGWSAENFRAGRKEAL